MKINSSTLALTLQKLESDAMLNHLVPAIIRELPQAKIYTIHDSIMTIDHKETRKRILDLMQVEIEKYTGYTSRYLVYAISGIKIGVTGILIALQIR